MVRFTALLALFSLAGYPLPMFVGNTQAQAQTLNTRETLRAIDRSTRECMKGYAIADLKVTKNPNVIIEKELSNCWVIARTAISSIEMTSQEILNYLSPIALEEFNLAKKYQPDPSVPRNASPPSRSPCPYGQVAQDAEPHWVNGGYQNFCVQDNRR
jgi:hypothetical protein